MQQKEYKALLVDKLMQKDVRSTVLNQRKNEAMNQGQRLHSNLQEAFFRTAISTNNAILPVPFEKYQKDFENIKEPIAKQQPD